MDLDSEDIRAILEKIAWKDDGTLVGIGGGVEGGIGGISDCAGRYIVAVDLLTIEIKDTAIVDLIGKLVVGIFAQSVDGGKIE